MLGLGESKEELAFLRRLRTGAKLSLADNWDLDLWDPVCRIGETIDAIDLVCSKTGLELDQFKLADLDDQEFALSVMVLDGIARGVAIQDTISGFVVGPAANQAIEPWHGGNYEIPLIANLKRHTVIAWLRGRCLVPVVDGSICGFRPLTQTGVRWEVHPKTLSTGGRPQLWIANSWPAIDVLDGVPPGSHIIDPANHPVSGHIELDG